MATEPDGIQPDRKDWTWVLQRPCLECGFTPEVGRDQLAAAMAASIPGWADRLADRDAGTRVSPSRWSALEYAAHVRDMAQVMRYRLGLILNQDEPLFPDWDQDGAAVAGDYRAQDHEVVARDLAAAVTELAGAYADLPAQAWDRGGRRSNGARFTAYTLGLYALHDLQHHRHDAAVAQG
ncbi:MAG: DinB family protein [Beutenbergiaceae bacterium]